jgi:hypothetical protein
MIGGLVRYLEDSHRGSTQLRGCLDHARESMFSDHYDLFQLIHVRVLWGVLPYDQSSFHHIYLEHVLSGGNISAKQVIRHQMRGTRYDLKMQSGRVLTLCQIKEDQQLKSLGASKRPLRRALDQKQMELCNANPRVWPAEAFKDAMASHRKYVIMCSNDARVAVREFYKPSMLDIRVLKSQMARRRAFGIDTTEILTQLNTNRNEVQHLVTDYNALVLFRPSHTPLPMLQNEISAAKAMYLRMMEWFRIHKVATSWLTKAQS